MNLSRNRIFKLELIVYVTIFLMGLWGCLAIYNATVFTLHPFYNSLKQLLWLIIGLLTLFVSSKIPFWIYYKLLIPLGILSYLSLILVLFCGKEVHSMTGWFIFGPVYIQPSEFTKIPFIMILSLFVCKKEQNIKLFLMSILFTVLWILPIILQPDFGTMIVYLSGGFVVYWLGGIKKQYLIAISFLLCIILGFIIYMHPYMIGRLEGFINPGDDFLGKGWHITQLRYTLARGGFWGNNLGNALWSNSYLPLAYSDSAFASLTESVGFIGSFPVIIGFTSIIFITYKLAMTIDNKFQQIVIISLITLSVIQAFIHISVNLTFFPTTGITLPFISYGGSSLVSTCLSFGIALSAVRGHKKLNEKNK